MTINVDTTFDVVEKQKELAAALMGEDSIYIRMKETLVDLLEKGEIKGTDRARVVSETVAQMAVNLANTSMSTALAWQAQEKELVLKKEEIALKKEELALKKEELEVRLDILQKEIEKAAEDARLAKESVRLAQAKRIREYGTATFDPDGNVIALGNSGLVYQQEQLVKKQVEQGAAAISKINDDMITSLKQRANIEKQTELYQRQKEGFDDNKYQKLFESQINAWGLMFSSGMLTEKPAIIRGDKVSQLYNQLTSSL